MTKNIIASLLLTMVVGIAIGQSLKSNRTFVPYNIPKKGELTGYKSYQVKLLTKVFVLTDYEVKELGGVDNNPTGVDIKNSEKKAQWARQYLTADLGKGSSQVAENASADILVLLETTDFVFKDLSNDMAGAKPEDVLARIEGSAVLRVIDLKTKNSLLEKMIEIPEEDAILTKDKVLTLSPELSLKLKFVKKDVKRVESMLMTALNDTRPYYMQYFLTQASCTLQAAYKDQKSGFQIPLYSVRGKMDYTDLDRTIKSIQATISGLEKNQSIAAIKLSPLNNVLREAITLWQKELSMQSTEKDARINEEIARGLNLNLATAFILMGEWDNAHSALSRTGIVIPEGLELTNTGTAKEFFMNIQRVYYEASPAADQILFTFK